MTTSCGWEMFRILLWDCFFVSSNWSATQSKRPSTRKLISCFTFNGSHSLLNAITTGLICADFCCYLSLDSIPCHRRANEHCSTLWTLIYLAQLLRFSIVVKLRIALLLPCYWPPLILLYLHSLLKAYYFAENIFSPLMAAALPEWRKQVQWMVVLVLPRHGCPPVFTLKALFALGFPILSSHGAPSFAWNPVSSRHFIEFICNLIEFALYDFPSEWT